LLMGNVLHRNRIDIRREIRGFEVQNRNCCRHFHDCAGRAHIERGNHMGGLAHLDDDMICPVRIEARALIETVYSPGSSSGATNSPESPDFKASTAFVAL